jgi:hypothetical protein
MSRFDPPRSPSSDLDRTESRRAGRLRCSMLGSNQGEVLDISATGAKLLLRRQPSVKAGDEFKLELESMGGNISVDCAVVWLRLNAEKKFEMGIEFRNLTTENKRRLLETVLHPTRSETLRRGWTFVPEPAGDDDSGVDIDTKE